jgi:hypothetical protein
LGFNPRVRDHQRVRATLNAIKAAIASDGKCTSNAGVMRSASDLRWITVLVRPSSP